MKDIPHIIHYCWFGPKKFSELETKCIESWKRFLPDYELKLWNEETFNLESSLFAFQAYQMGKYAFVSDCVRTKVLYEYGGLYMDTDFEILKPIDDILTDCNILGFETRAHLGTAIMAFAPHHQVVGKFMQYYDSHSFVDSKGRIDNIANVGILTDILTPMGLKNDNSMQIIGDIRIYPREFFYPKRLETNEFRFTEETVCVHRCTNSWMTDKQKRRGSNKFWIKVCRPLLNKGRLWGIRLFGNERIRKVEIIVRNLLK